MPQSPFEYVPPPPTPSTTPSSPFSYSPPPISTKLPETEDDDSWLEWIGTSAKDVAVGAAKSLLQQGVRGGELLRKIPGVSMLDYLLEPIKVDLEQKNTAQKAGGLAFELAESVVPAKAVTSLALKAGSLLPAASLAGRAAVEGGVAAGTSALQGQDATVSGVLGAAAPLVGKAISWMPDGLMETAKTRVRQAFGAQKPRYEAMVEKHLDQILATNLKGTREEMLEQAQAAAAPLKADLDAVIAQHGDEPFPTSPIVEKLEELKNKFRGMREVSSRQVATDPRIAAKAIPTTDPHVYNLPIEIDSRPVRQLEKLQDILTDLGPETTKRQIIAVRKVWDEVVDKAGGFSDKAAGGRGLSLKEQSEAWAKKEATSAIRTLLAETTPDLAKVNKELSFWLNVKDVLHESVARTAAAPNSKMASAVETGGRLFGGVVTSPSGVLGSITGAFAVGKLAKSVHGVLTSPKWRMVDARLKQQLAEAIVSDKVQDISVVLARIGAVQAGKVVE